jgi:hypothetical protein
MTIEDERIQWQDEVLHLCLFSKQQRYTRCSAQQDDHSPEAVLHSTALLIVLWNFSSIATTPLCSKPGTPRWKRYGVYISVVVRH